MNTVYTCQTCNTQVHPGEGYIHSSRTGRWRIDHNGCFDMTHEYCLAVPRNWIDLLSAHRFYAHHTKVAA